MRQWDRRLKLELERLRHITLWALKGPRRGRHNHIHSSPEFIVGLLAGGWRQQQVAESYPALAPDSLKAVFAFTAEGVRKDALYATAGEVKG